MVKLLSLLAGTPLMSASYVKVPEKNVARILLAVTDGLRAGYGWTGEGVRATPYGRFFFATLSSSAE